jgi:hypothetical protein
MKIKEGGTELMKVIVRAFGEEREFEILDRAAIEDILRNLSPSEIIEKAWGGYISGLKSGYAVVDLRDGQLKSVSLGSNESLHPFDDLYVYLYKIDQNFEPFCEEEILSPEEYKNWKESDKSLEVYAEEYEINLNERQKESLEYYFNDTMDWIFVYQQLDEWYLNAEPLGE